MKNTYINLIRKEYLKRHRSHFETYFLNIYDHSTLNNENLCPPPKLCEQSIRKKNFFLITLKNPEGLKLREKFDFERKLCVAA